MDAQKTILRGPAFADMNQYDMYYMLYTQVDWLAAKHHS